MTVRLKMKEGNRSAAKKTPNSAEAPKKCDSRRSLTKPRTLETKIDSIKTAAAEVTDVSFLPKIWLTTKRV